MLRKGLTKRLLIAVLCTGAAMPLAAQELDPAVEATHDEIRALKSGVEEAFNLIGSSGADGDIEPLLQFVHDDVVLVAMNGETVVGKQGIRDYFQTKMAGPEPTVASIHHTFNVAALTTLYGDDTGVAYGDSPGQYELTNGMSFDVNTYWTATMVREDGQWLIASFQFAPSIFENPLAEEAFGMVKRVGIIAGIVGLILGFLLARLFGRRASNA